MPTTLTQSIEESNAVLYSLVSSTQPFHIARLSDNATKVSLHYTLTPNSSIPQYYVSTMDTHDGIYCKTKTDIELYARIYNEGIMNAKYLACFPSLCIDQQNIYLSMRKEEKGLHNRALEPFYLLQSPQHKDPWTYALRNKKVLIIHPFIESFKRQVTTNKFQFTPPLFHADQEFIFYRTFNCLAGNRPHNNWFETYTTMIKDIKSIDFDIALISCGGYAVPLCNYISQTLKKQAINIGGGLQLFFGVYGSRWESHEIIGPLIRQPDSKWIRPSEDEKIPAGMMIERGCYW